MRCSSIILLGVNLFILKVLVVESNMFTLSSHNCFDVLRLYKFKQVAALASVQVVTSMKASWKMETVDLRSGNRKANGILSV